MIPAAHCDAWHELLCLTAGSLLPFSYGRSSRLTRTFCSSHRHYSMCSNHSQCSRYSMLSTIASASAAFGAHTHQALSKNYEICMSVIGSSSIIVHSKSCHLAAVAATGRCMANCEPYKPEHCVQQCTAVAHLLTYLSRAHHGLPRQNM